jgi:hypothetical protein
MVTSVFFDTYSNFSEQNLLEDLIVESIRIYGQDLIYLPRTLINYDEILGESDIVKYDKSYTVEMYIRSVDGFEGDGSFLSKFGLEIRDRITLTVAKRVFDEEIGTYTSFPRPREGDLIYFPLNDKCFQIRYTDNKPFFYQLGSLPMYDLTCELFEYSGEIFETGIPEIDKLQQRHSFNVFDHALLAEDDSALMTEDNRYLVKETFSDDQIFLGSADNEAIQLESDQFVDWSERDPFSSTGKY